MYIQCNYLLLQIRNIYIYNNNNNNNNNNNIY